MRGDQILTQKQSQSIVMTPQLQQAVKLLELSNIELMSYLENAVLENPLLALEKPSTDAELPSAASDDQQDEINENIWSNLQTSRQHVHQEAQSYSIERLKASPMTLREHLMSQLNTDMLDSQDLIIGRSLIDAIDPTGYITEDLGKLAKRFGCSLQRIEETLYKLQQFDPGGIFARNLQECLKLQLQDTEYWNEKTEAFLEHMELFFSGHNKRFLLRTGLEPEDCKEILAHIRTLNPKPGLNFDFDDLPYIIPDVIVRSRPDNSWHVSLNSDTLPKVLVDKEYATTVRASTKDSQAKKYVTACLASANHLVNAMDQRAQNILKVSEEIIRRQEKFMTDGIEHLVPMVLKDVAEAVEIHESTVSRVTNHKYMMTPRGVFELKYFFSSSICNMRGEGVHSSEAIRHKIKLAVGEEDPASPFSDDDLVRVLRSQSIDIARRTVAKYREELGIPSSYQRKRAHRLENSV
ncbi:MAG: RNA polymerase factor sigma-54 [Alphaproteobacteria bacterium]